MDDTASPLPRSPTTRSSRRPGCTWGPCALSTGKPGQLWRAGSTDLAYSPWQTLKSPIIGAAYKVRVDRTGMIVRGTPKFVQADRLPQAELVERRALALAFEAGLRQERAESKAKREDLSRLADVLEPIASAYARSSSVGRREILAEVIRLVTTGVR